METIYEVVKIKQVIREVTEQKFNTRITSPDAAFKIATYFIGDDDREIFLVMCLSTKNEVVGVHRCHVGSLNASLANCREIFKAAILNNSSSVIIAHQHPSGYLDPSSQDIQVTKKVAEAGRYLDIELLDSIIVNYKGEGISLKEKGYL
jgi:DNA repair protein RadC